MCSLPIVHGALHMCQTHFCVCFMENFFLTIKISENNVQPQMVLGRTLH